MAFFDSKQEVLKIELTPYGKKKLADGTFKPKFYSFHDDDILYDVEFTGAPPEANSTSYNRILEETPYLKPIPRTQAVEITKNIKTKNKDYKILAEDGVSALGNSSLNSDYMPAWSIQIINGQIESYVKESFQSIPQINLKPIFHKITLIKPEEEKLAEDILYEDGSAVRLAETYRVIDIEEKNVDILEDHYDMEIFEVIGEELRPIMFTKQQQNVINGIFKEDSELPAQNTDIPDQNMAESMFSIFVDDEIDIQETINQEVMSAESLKLNKPPYGEDC